MSYQQAAEVATYTTLYEHKRRISMSSEGFETRKPSKHAAAILRLTLHEHRDWHRLCEQ